MRSPGTGAQSWIILRWARFGAIDRRHVPAEPRRDNHDRLDLQTKKHKEFGRRVSSLSPPSLLVRSAVSFGDANQMRANCSAVGSAQQYQGSVRYGIVTTWRTSGDGGSGRSPSAAPAAAVTRQTSSNTCPRVRGAAWASVTTAITS